jgi:poly(hydroxyalkanoate) depolymerase family esterase
MKLPFNPRAPDIKGIQATIQRALAAAGLDTRSGAMRQVTDVIGRALGGAEPRAADRPGNTESHSFSNQAGTRSYKLHVPPHGSSTPPPLLVMLHGCTQSADDFAAGTQMNRLADQHGMLVVYPEQSASANPSTCWNWFQPQDQQRDSGEPSLIAGIVAEVAARHGVDRRRIFVAGLSAGAAMALILGRTYPELFAAVGAHSGLPCGSAHDIGSALAAMKGAPSRTTAAPRSPAQRAVPVIVFHGDRDHTVQASNGQRIVQQALAAHDASTPADVLVTHSDSGTAPGGRSWRRTVHADARGRPFVESWTVLGAGHAWSGGSAAGSFTDSAGPDASAAMLKFFLAQEPAGTS